MALCVESAMFVVGSRVQTPFEILESLAGLARVAPIWPGKLARISGFPICRDRGHIIWDFAQNPDLPGNLGILRNFGNPDVAK